MIVLFTDFGVAGPYVGQMKAVLAHRAPGVPVIDLMHDAPAFDPQAAAYLLASLLDHVPADAVVCAVVDPGVGGDRPPVAVRADGRWLVGPGNGLFEIVRRRARTATVERLTLDTGALSATFHGRDLFAPAAAAFALGQAVPAAPIDEPLPGADWPDDLAHVIYIDGYGNAMTGLRAAAIGPQAAVSVAGQHLDHARTFADVPAGRPFWYANSQGLVEIAVNRGDAADTLALAIGSPVAVDDPRNAPIHPRSP